MKIKKIYQIVPLFFCLSLSAMITAQTIIINEVMFNAVGADDYDEYIEIVNTGSDSLDLAGLYLIINGSVDSLAFVDLRSRLGPGAYGLILDRGYLIDGRSTTYDSLIPSGSLLCTIKDNAFGKTGLPNTSPANILLLDQAGDTLSEMNTKPDQSAGYPDERIDIYGEDELTNWGNGISLYGTPGYVNSIAIKDVDLAITEFDLRDNGIRLRPGSIAEFHVKLKNVGRNAVTGAVVRFGADTNSDKILQDKEIVSTKNVTLSSGDSLVFYPALVDVNSGKLTAICVIATEDDGPENNSAACFVKVAYPQNCVAINEFLYAPRADYGGEWIELLNVSADTINLAGWQIGDNSSRIEITAGDIFVPPSEYVVLSSEESVADYWELGGIYIHCENSLPSLNNTEDSVVVRDLCGQVIDSLKYTSGWGYRQGVSVERINPWHDSNVSGNWALSQDPTGGTPGRRNSIVVKDYDLAVAGIGLLDSSARLKPGDKAELIVNIQNRGRKTIEEAELYLGIDSNGDSLLQQNEVLYIDILTVDPGDSVILYPSILDIESGKNLVVCSIVTEDEDNENNSAVFLLKVSYPAGAVAINEFMYAPRSDYGGEWIELLNVSADTINLAGWQIGDNSSLVEITANDIFAPPSEYVVLSSDESIADYWELGGIYIHCENSLPSLNNTEDSIVVRDLCGQVIDSLKYTSGWGYRQGVSVERINPWQDSDLSGNWTLSQDPTGGTPGRKNSQMVKTYDLSVDTVYVVSEDLIHNGAVAFEYIIGNNGLADIGGHTVYLGIRTATQSPEHRTIRDTVLYIEEPIPAGSVQIESTIFDKVPGGVHQAYCEIFYVGDEQLSNDKDSCLFIVGYPENSVVINEVMNIPESGETEWFELFNTSDIEIDLNQWSFRDAGGGWQKLTTETEYLVPSGFCIVAARADFRQAYPNFSGSLIVPDNFPTLNNTSDSLFLADGSERVIDGVFFRQDWGGGTGVSLERKDPNAPAVSSFNWGGTLDPAGATPGQKNSILKYRYDLTIVPGSFRFSDSTVTLVQPATFQVDVINSGSRESYSFALEIYHDVNGDKNASPTELVWSLYNIPALMPDSTITLDGEIYAEKSGRCQYLAVIAMSNENDAGDNVATCDLLVGFPVSTVRINEFLAYPGAEQTEFIEIFCAGDDINLNEWQLEDSRSAIKLFHSTALARNEYLLLAEDSSFFEIYAVDFPVIIPRKWPGLSNTGDKIVIRDPAGIVIDSLVYDDQWTIVPGVSLEKRLPDDPSEQLQFWSLSEDQSGATPGADNSIMPRPFDLKMDSVSTVLYEGGIDSEMDIVVWFTNVGQNSSVSAAISVCELDHDNVSVIETMPVKEIPPGRQDSLRMNIGPFSSGVHRLVFFINWEQDSNADNDSVYLEIRTAYPENSLLLSEFMANPLEIITEDKPHSEYIEIYNPSREIRLTGWQICDENTGAPVEITEQRTVLAGDYFVIAADSSVFKYPHVKPSATVVLERFPALNNTADAIYLKDPTGKTIDSLVYDSQWAVPPGISLERVYFSNPNILSNWRYSTDSAGGTPGAGNSVAIEDNAEEPGVRVEPNPFSPNGDGIDDEVAIIFQLPFPSASVSVQIYDLMGRLIYEPARNVISSAEGAVYWDGSSQYGNRARIGMYIVRCSAADIASDKTVGYITTVVLAR